jgi:CHAT domain-containing protein
MAMNALQGTQSRRRKPVETRAESPLRYSDVEWLLKKYPITVLPAVGSLRALRAFAKPKPAAEPFVGFGDPVFEGGAGAARNVTLAKLFSRGTVADVRELRQLDRLPETADELRAIAASLNGETRNLYLGPDATETRLKSLDLTSFRHIVFATHGLMAGDIRGLAEPGLVLTPPQQGSDLDDGILTGSEIAQLKLNADWVILSACNTAAADGTPGAEGLSGLVKAFFYAGARSLLVSHWAVSSEAAVAITTRIFEESAGGASKSQALQRSTLALLQRQDKLYLQHPSMWAPFIVVGEGR